MPQRYSTTSQQVDGVGSSGVRDRGDDNMPGNGTELKHAPHYVLRDVMMTLPRKALLFLTARTPTRGQQNTVCTFQSRYGAAGESMCLWRR